MTADFENDEIKDSSFPIDFKDDAETLDMYGVWVKSGPRDAKAGARKETPPATVETAFTDDISADIAALPDFNDFIDSNDMNAAIPETDEVSFSETVEPEEQELAVFDDLGTETEPAIDLGAETTDEYSFDTLADMSFDSISIPSDETHAEEPSDAFAEEEYLSAESAAPFDDIAVDSYSLEPDTEEPETFEETVLGEAEFVEPEMELAKPAEETAFQEESAVSDTEEIGATPVTEEFSLDDFLAPSPESPVAEVSETPSEDDFSSFLDDLNLAPSQGEQPTKTSDAADDFDLDSLISSVNEAGSLEQESERLFDDTEPLNIDLEFDESFIEDAEKIKATGSAVSESEFFNSEFGVELVDETAGSATVSRAAAESDMDFDSMFASVEADGAFKAEQPTARESESSFLEDTSEFDDLLQSLDAAPVPAPVSDKGKGALPSSSGFDLAVTEEDSLESISTSVSDSSVDEDFSVSLVSGESPSLAKADENKPFVPTKEPQRESLSDEEFEALIEPLVDDGPAVEDTAVPLTSGDFSAIGDEVPLFENESTVAESGSAIASELDSVDLEAFTEAAPETGNVEEFVDLTNFKDYNSSESDKESEISETISVEEPVSLEFDDISAVEKDLTEDNPVTGDTTVVTNDKSTELLMIIADELSSIKKEISTLKSELAGFKSAAPAESASADAAGTQNENSGFFSDDDTDETIALTGDELNNILITADFTEEKSEEEPTLTVEPEESTIPDSDTVQTASGFESVGAIPTEEHEAEIPETLPETIFDVPGFDGVENIEVSHVNTIHDDVSYLEGSDTIEADLDNVAIEEPELEIIDFEDEKLEEPELTEFNIDLTDMEKDFPAEQEIAVEMPAADVTSLQEESGEPALDEFATSETLSNEELASIGEDVSGTVDESVESAPAQKTEPSVVSLPVDLKDEIKSVLSYMDQLLESLPEEKIEEFARSEHFEVYKKLFEELGIS
jgi:hypothetical protein